MRRLFLMLSCSFRWLRSMDFFSRGRRRLCGAFRGVCWLLLFGFGPFKSKKRGLWLLVGLPFVLFWPHVFFMISLGCALNAKSFRSQLREDPDFARSSLSSAVRI